MAGFGLQINLAGITGLPLCILPHQFYISICAQRAATCNLRKDTILFRQLERIDTDVLRPGILREPRSEKMVGAIQTFTVARQSGPLHQRCHSWKRRERSTDEAEYREVCRFGLCYHPSEDFAKG